MFIHVPPGIVFGGTCATTLENTHFPNVKDCINTEA